MGLEPGAAPSARIQFEARASSGTTPRLPALIDPQLPSVDRIAHQVRARLGDTATASVELCVSAAGKVSKVELVRGADYARFNRALLRDVERWQFAAMPGPSTLQACDTATISYVPHR